MLAAHDADAYLERLARVLPAQIPTPDGPLTAASIIGTIRNDLLPHITGGPGYNRAADDNLQRALAAYRRGDAADALR